MSQTLSAVRHALALATRRPFWDWYGSIPELSQEARCGVWKRGHVMSREPQSSGTSHLSLISQWLHVRYAENNLRTINISEMSKRDCRLCAASGTRVGRGKIDSESIHQLAECFRFILTTWLCIEILCLRKIAPFLRSKIHSGETNLIAASATLGLDTAMRSTCVQGHCYNPVEMESYSLLNKCLIYWKASSLAGWKMLVCHLCNSFRWVGHSLWNCLHWQSTSPLAFSFCKQAVHHLYVSCWDIRDD